MTNCSEWIIKSVSCSSKRLASLHLIVFFILPCTAAMKLVKMWASRWQSVSLSFCDEEVEVEVEE